MRSNVETLLEVLDAYNSGDMARIAELTDPAFEAEVSAEVSAEPDTYRGHDGVRRYFLSFWDAMEDIRFHAERLRERGDRVVAVVRLTATGRHTAIPVEQRVVLVWRFRSGRALSVRTYATEAEALGSLGLDV